MVQLKPENQKAEHGEPLASTFCTIAQQYRRLSQKELEFWRDKDLDSLQSVTGLTISEELLEFSWLAELRSVQIQYTPIYELWSVHLIHRKKKVVGFIGFHSEPNPAYLTPYIHDAIELGYTTLRPFRRQGIAAQAVTDMMRFAAKKGVLHTVLSISPANEASLALAKRLNFRRIATTLDPIDGHEHLFARTNV